MLHVQDLELDAAFEVGHLKSKWLRALGGVFERSMLRGFDTVVTISERMRSALARKGVSQSRLAVIRNWVDLSKITSAPVGQAADLRAELGLDLSQYVVLYAGHIGKKQALDGVVAAASALQSLQNIKFVIAGEGPEKARLIEECGGLQNVRFLPLQSPERFNALLATANLHVLPQLATVADLVLPSKVGGILASGRPCVVTAERDTELGQFLRGAAIFVPPGDTEALADAIRQAQAANHAAIVRNGLALAQTLSSRHLLANFTDLLTSPRKSKAPAAHVDQAAGYDAAPTMQSGQNVGL